MSTVRFEDRSILIDGKKTQIISGAMHYFRIPREYWRDRLQKAVQLGLNCVETYMAWNLHERREGRFDFSGMLDFEAFIRLAQELGLHVIVRPGPYICAEWDNGGFPSWLATKPGIHYRRMDKAFLGPLDRYMRVVLPKLAALQHDSGGPVIAMQIENEYGSYSCDKAYLRHLRQLYLDAGVTVPLFTADGTLPLMLAGGRLDGAPVCLNFGSRGLEAFDAGAEASPSDPPVCMEFWCGWFDAWGAPHHTRSAKEVAEETDDMLAAGGSLNYYMFHGGTNFFPGANGSDESPYTPDTTSYDYDALLDEAGDPTAKYFAVQEVIRKYAPDRAFGTPLPSTKLAPRQLPVSAVAPLFENLSALCGEPVRATSPMTFEELGQDFGYVYYRTRVGGCGAPLRGTFALRHVRDRANVYLDGRPIHTYFRNDKSNRTPACEIPAAGAELSLLVENLGRINYGHLTGRDTKGICEDVAFEFQTLVDWEIFPVPHEDPDAAGRIAWKPFSRVLRGSPAYYLVAFDVEEPADAFLQFPGIEGHAWINGRSIGRYWSIGPGQTLYVPGCWLKKGRNRLVLFETEKLLKPYVRLVDRMELSENVHI